ncbi:unnamed protein product [Moneuplotes crassus]|uniref:AGC-kinase C-terminal domain-containing protein n=1 Tax=Euplotes crassus TaxID=5936 RepID=A0AAD1XU89_EUPCR|nr:unnamed protein product [Moneuplotes crassus]
MKNLIKLILVNDPAARLELDEIKDHPFFNKVDWSNVEKLSQTPPYIPKEFTNHGLIMAKYKGVNLKIEESFPKMDFSSFNDYNLIRVNEEFKNF